MFYKDKIKQLIYIYFIYLFLAIVAMDPKLVNYIDLLNILYVSGDYNMFFYILLSVITFYFYNFFVITIQPMVILIFFTIICLFPLLVIVLSIAFYVLFERKLMASMQRRRGPNIVGVFGLLQPFADALKAILKETLVPGHSNKILFIVAPIFTFFISLASWMVFPFFNGAVFVSLHFDALFVFALTSLHVYGVIFSGWSSNSKYAFLGGLRSTSQVIAYEIVMGLILILIVYMTQSFSLSGIANAQQHCWLVFPLFPVWIIFIIVMLAETNRAPFDLPEAEAELVAGYNVEYSGLTFALFFLGEYGSMLFISGLSCVFFFGGWHSPFFLFYIFEYTTSSYFVQVVWYSLKLALHVSLFIWIRAAFPRFRYDQVMRLCWKVFIPFLLSLIIFEVAINNF